MTGTRLEEVQAVADTITYKEAWKLKVLCVRDTIFLQWKFMERDNTNPNDTVETEQGSRKWVVSDWATYSEIVNTAYLAVEIAEKHEMMEKFQVNGKTLYNPHQSVSALLDTNLPNDSRQNIELSGDVPVEAVDMEQSDLPQLGTFRFAEIDEEEDEE